MPGLEGTSLGRYHLERRLGRGGMAEVYLANDQRMHRLVAVKVVSTSQTEFAERFSRETEAMGNLHHDHILPAYDYGEQEPWHYLVMPYIADGTLSDRLKQGPLSLEDAGELFQQIASALQYAHKSGLIHRDIKPSNILLRDEHYAYLADFGLARILERGHDLTVTGTLLGTPEYMAPELSEGPASVSSDTYALAVVLYEMISGRVPFQGDTAISVFWKHIRDYPAVPSRHNPAIPKELDQVLMRALDKDPQRRYATPLALAQAYQDALAGVDDMPSLYATDALPVQPSPVPPVFSPPLPAQSQPERLVLPAISSPSTPPAFKRPHPPITPASMPMQQQRTPTTDQALVSASGKMSRPGRRRRRRARSNQAIVGIIMGVIFLVAVSSALAYLTIQTRQQNAASATATARVAATNGVIAQKTQQSQNAQQTATAISAAATAQAQATRRAIQATATAITSSTPLLSDPLSGPDDNGWPDDGSSCAFANNRYVVNAHGSSTLQPCIAGSSQMNYSDAAFQVEVTLLAGNDAGLIFRTGADGNQFYDFEITDQGQFYLRYRNHGKYTSLITMTPSSAILGTGSQNTLLVIASGSDFRLFINHTFVDEVHDTTFAIGQIGLVVGTLTSNSGEASFANLAVYKV